MAARCGVRTALVALRSFMETDPKGQLGGLETSDAVRRRLAADSQGFRCVACGKTNSEIIKACEEAAREHEAEQGSASKEVEVPSDLKMGWRDEMEAKAKASGTGTGNESGNANGSTPSPAAGGSRAEEARILRARSWRRGSYRRPRVKTCKIRLHSRQDRRRACRSPPGRYLCPMRS